jgi:hypothetical protein
MGFALVTVRLVVLATLLAPSSSVATRLRAKVPPLLSSVQVTWAFFLVSLSKEQLPPASMPAVLTVHLYVRYGSSLSPGSSAEPFNVMADPSYPE